MRPPSPPPDRVSVRPGYRGRLLAVDIETVTNPAGHTMELEIVRHPGAAAVVPLISPPTARDPQILVLNQYRYAAGGPIWEIPAGVLEPGEEPEACARRELAEETGATGGRLEHLTTIFTTPGFTDERIHLFLASDITVGEEPRPQPDEFIEVGQRSISELLAMIRDGRIVDGKSIAALLYVASFNLHP